MLAVVRLNLYNDAIPSVRKRLAKKWKKTLQNKQKTSQAKKQNVATLSGEEVPPSGSIGFKDRVPYHQPKIWSIDAEAVLFEPEVKAQDFLNLIGSLPWRLTSAKESTNLSFREIGQSEHGLCMILHGSAVLLRLSQFLQFGSPGTSAPRPPRRLLPCVKRTIRTGGEMSPVEATRATTSPLTGDVHRRWISPCGAQSLDNQGPL